MPTIEEQVAALLEIVVRQGEVIIAQGKILDGLARQAGLPNAGSGLGPWNNFPGTPVTPEPPKPPAWVPTFEKGHTKEHWGVKYPMIEWDYADAATAEEVRKRLNGARVASKSRIPDVEDPMNWIVFADDVWANAGRLAKYYLDQPEDLYPGTADKLALAAVEEKRKTAGPGVR